MSEKQESFSEYLNRTRKEAPKVVASKLEAAKVSGLEAIAGIRPSYTYGSTKPLNSIDMIITKNPKDETKPKTVKVLIAGGYGGSYDIKWLFPNKNYSMTKNIQDADLVVLTGGADIDPAIYGENCNSKTYISEHRDTAELEHARQAIDLKIPMIGICRGAQMLCALAGGKLVQHVTNHGYGHRIRIIEGQFRNYVLPVNSMHHQMMFPFNLNQEAYNLIAISDHAISQCYEGSSKDEILDVGGMEPEIIFFKNIKGYAIQCHPEMMSGIGETVETLDVFIQDIFSRLPELIQKEVNEPVKNEDKNFML